MLVELINATLTQRPLNAMTFGCVTEEEWQCCFNMALAQGVLAMTFPAISSLPKELRPSFSLWSKWMAYTDDITKQSQYKREIVKQMGAWLTKDGLSTTILKGFSLSILYPNPNLREFCDIDIFSGGEFEAVNKCFAKHGVELYGVDGHHAYLNANGISIEHHFAFSNTKVKKGLVGPEEALQSMILTDLKPTAIRGVYLPNTVFTVLFIGWHAYEHFLQEKIQLRHVIDWALALRQLNESDVENVIKIKEKNKWGQFTVVLTAIALHKMKLPEDWFPEKELKLADGVKLMQEQKIWNDILKAPNTHKSKNHNWHRLSIAMRILRNGWKFNDYADIKAYQFLWKEFVGHIMTML